MKFENASVYRQILANSVPFRGLADEAIDSLLDHGMVLNAEKDELVFYEHMRGGLGLYVILDGEIEIFKSEIDEENEQANTVHLATLTPGQCFGEYSLIDGLKTSAAAKALVESKLFLLSRGAFEEAINSDAESGRTIYRNLLEFLVERLRRHP